MTKLRRNLMALALCSATLFALSDPTPAQDAFPSRTVRFVVGFPPGGGVDAVARLFAEKLSVIFGQPVVVMNHPGAAGGIAGKQVSADPPDGYTVLVNSNSMVVYSLMNPKTDLVVERDLQAVISVAPQAIILVASPNTPVNSVSELIALARTRPLNYGTPGSGSIPHLVIEQLLTTQPGVHMQHVPFQGASPALTAAMANQIDIASVTLPPAASAKTQMRTVRPPSTARGTRRPSPRPCRRLRTSHPLRAPVPARRS